MQELKTMEHEVISKMQVMRPFQKEITVYKNPFMPQAITKEFDDILEQVPQELGVGLRRIELTHHKSKPTDSIGGWHFGDTDSIQIVMHSKGQQPVTLGLKGVIYHEFGHHTYTKHATFEQFMSWASVIDKYGLPTAYPQSLKDKGEPPARIYSESHAEMVAYLFAKHSRIQYGKKHPGLKVYEDVAEQLLPHLIEIFGYHKFIPLLMQHRVRGDISK